ncbi:hypothetical protein E2C01_031965 [Portunus trituberculatus]|uniref:Uncharacterized protein n=1 Tax=Portunus trituberculatus TaxID=210409 RepID=A0A5B7EZM7_PORTR|nr:hypothetical protein [Portunus trituberculatus]
MSPHIKQGPQYVWLDSNRKKSNTIYGVLASLAGGIRISQTHRRPVSQSGALRQAVSWSAPGPATSHGKMDFSRTSQPRLPTHVLDQELRQTRYENITHYSKPFTSPRSF